MWSKKGTEGDQEAGPCTERWKNMMQEIMARMWGILNETGVFLSLSCDMVRSGKLILAVSTILAASFNQLLTTVHWEKRHGNLDSKPSLDCSMAMHTTVTVGLEDLEGCDMLQLSTTDRQFLRISDFLSNNYHQAFDILDGSCRSWCEGWRREKEQYLEGLERMPEIETLQMEYLKAFHRLFMAQCLPEKISIEQEKYLSTKLTNTANTNTREAQHRHLQERHCVALEEVQVLERHLEIQEWWTPLHAEWKEAEKLVENMEYQQALDQLEGLIHVGKALKTHSQAIQTAVNCYNKAAAKKGQPELDFQTVVDYTFLAEFDLLYKEAFLLAKEQEEQDQALAYQIQCYRAQHTQFNQVHFKKLSKLLKQDRCMATFIAGVGSLSSWRQDSSMALEDEKLEEEFIDANVQEEEGIAGTYDNLVLCGSTGCLETTTTSSFNVPGTSGMLTTAEMT
ncbi:hypothetical protein L218DRAFT_951515 [Marasmius fiardii PR-910]|nr:hypothetical protein L218DRAFT_951565 [Marasmius fiardii PR-910]KAF9254488.1 hypothetical protein L218DRAFT_951515 [Marasmius fiardii PR-910]